MKHSKNNGFRMAEAFHPGEFLKDILQDRNWSQADFADITGIVPPRINSVINGKALISVQMAKVFGEAIGTSAKYWLNLQSLYDLWMAEEKSNHEHVSEVARRARLYAFPIREMAKRHWVEETKDLERLEEQVLAFFEVSLTEDIPDLQVAARRSRSEEPMTPHQLAWLFRARQLARVLDVPTYKRRKLEASLDDLMALRLSPEATRDVPRILSSCGVRFVVVEGLSGLKADGVCFWLEEKHPVIAMSLRHDRIDNFWFTLRHEIEHVLRGDGKRDRLEDADVDFEESSSDDESTAKERIANDAAAKFCVDPREIDDCINRFSSYFSRTKLERVAKRIHVHPGVLVGQLHRHRRGLPYTHMRKLLVGVRRYVLETTLVDGWDITPQIDRER